MVLILALVLAGAAAGAALAIHSVLILFGLAAALYLGTRLGSWLALSRLAEFERRQRAWRVRNWRSGGG